MQHHRNGAPRAGLPEPQSRQYENEKLLLLELVVDPPTAGDLVEDLSAVLGLTCEELAAAAAALTVAGLAERRGDRVISTYAAKYFEHLWPVAL